MNIVHTNDPRETEKYLAEIGTLTEKAIEMNTVELARMHGWEDGIERGIQKGREEERAKFQTDKLTFALNLKKTGVPEEGIASSLNLNVEEIKRL